MLDQHRYYSSSNNSLHIICITATSMLLHYNKEQAAEQHRADRMGKERMRKERLFQLEGNNHLVQLPEQFGADQKLKHVIKGIVQMPL